MVAAQLNGRSVRSTSTEKKIEYENHKREIEVVMTKRVHFVVCTFHQGLVVAIVAKCSKQGNHQSLDDKPMGPPRGSPECLPAGVGATWPPSVHVV